MLWSFKTSGLVELKQTGWNTSLIDVEIMMKVTPCTTWWFRDTKELEFSLFRYVGSIIHKDGESEEDVNYMIRAGGEARHEYFMIIEYLLC